jgi:hypothetical protein
LQLILDGLCPECLNQHNPRKRRLFKKGIKRECSQGHLTIYGNPQYLAYFRVQEKEQKNSSGDCQTCKNMAIAYDKKHDELICTNLNCEHNGMVLAGPPQEIGPGRWVNHPLGNLYDYADVDKTYSPYEDDRCDYGDYISD